MPPQGAQEIGSAGQAGGICHPRGKYAEPGTRIDAGSPSAVILTYVHSVVAVTQQQFVSGLRDRENQDQEVEDRAGQVPTNPQTGKNSLINLI